MRSFLLVVSDLCQHPEGRVLALKRRVSAGTDSASGIQHLLPHSSVINRLTDNLHHEGILSVNATSEGREVVEK